MTKSKANRREGQYGRDGGDVAEGGEAKPNDRDNYVNCKGTFKCSTNGLDGAAKIKQTIHQNRLAERFRTRQSKPGDYRTNPIFRRLVRQFRPLPIVSDYDYQQTLRRALAVEVENRAVNYAYLLILDRHLRRYEELIGGRWEKLWDTVTNEIGKITEETKGE